MATNILTGTGGTPNIQAKAGPRQFQAVFDVIPFTVLFTEDSVTAQVQSQIDVSVPGAALGDFVLVAPKADATGLIPHAFVASAGVVTVGVFNTEGTDAVTTLAGGVVFNGIVLKPKVI